MNLGFDLDEVLSQTSQMAVDHLNDTHGTKFTMEIFKNFYFDENVYSDDEEEQKIIVDTLLDAVFNVDLLKTAQPYPGAVRALNMFKKQGHKIYIITKRAHEHTGETVGWLREHNFAFDKVVLTHNEDKGKFAKKFRLDCFVDDLEENLYDLYDSKSKWTKNPMLMTRPWNRNDNTDPSKITRVNDWTDIIKHISIGNRLRG